MKKTLTLVLLVLALFLLAAAAGAEYVHDPRLNPSAMADIVWDPDAVYGYSPSPDGSLAAYAAFDWTDPELVNGENGRLARIAYHESILDMYIILDDMRAEGKSTEEIARAVSEKRNEIRLAAYDGDPDGLAVAKERNLEKYGREEGPLPEDLFEQYGSWETVLWKAFSANPGMDACLGLYDDYYALYVASGMIDGEEETPASREYAAAALADAFGFGPAETGSTAPVFTDDAGVSPWYASSVESLASRGILRGYEDGSLRPGRAVTRLEACALLARCLSAGKTPDETASADPSVPAWASAEIACLAAEGLTEAALPAGASWDDPLTVAELKNLISAALTDKPVA